MRRSEKTRQSDHRQSDNKIGELEATESMCEQPFWYVEKPKPTVTQIMETITPCKTAAQVEVIWKSAQKYDWSEVEYNTIHECKENTLTRISLAA